MIHLSRHVLWRKKTIQKVHWRLKVDEYKCKSELEWVIISNQSEWLVLKKQAIPSKCLQGYEEKEKWE